MAVVRERTAERYAALRADPALREQHEVLAGGAANLSGVLRWLDKVEPREGWEPSGTCRTATA